MTRVWACRLPEFGCPCPHPGQPDPARFLCKSCQPLPLSLAHGGHPAAHSHRNRPPSSPGPVATAGAAGRAATSALSSLRLQTGWAMTVRGKMKAGRGRWEASSRPCSPRDAPRPPPCVGRDRPPVPKHSSQFLPLVRGVSEAGRARTPCPRACCGGPQPLMFFGLKVAGTGSASDGQAWEVGLRSVPCGRGLEGDQQDSLEVSPSPGAGQAHGSQPSEGAGEGSAGACGPRPGASAPQT